MTDDELAAIERRCRAATLGPWESDNTATEYSAILAMVNGGWEDLLCADNRVADAALMASARSDIPALVAEVRQLQEECRLLESSWLVHERIQPDGELAATLTDVVRENERLRDVLDQIANAGQWWPYHGRDLAAWMATTARVALGEQGYAK